MTIDEIALLYFCALGTTGFVVLGVDGRNIIITGQNEYSWIIFKFDSKNTQKMRFIAFYIVDIYYHHYFICDARCTMILIITLYSIEYTYMNMQHGTNFVI